MENKFKCHDKLWNSYSYSQKKLFNQIMIESANSVLDFDIEVEKWYKLRIHFAIMAAHELSKLS